MFQRSFSADDDMDEALLSVAADYWEDTPPEDVPAQLQGSTAVSQAPSKKSIQDYFSK